MLTALASAFRTGSLSPEDTSVDMLVGGTHGHGSGYLQAMCAKRKFMLWNLRNVELYVKGNDTHPAFYAEYQSKVLPSCSTARAIDLAFGTATDVIATKASEREQRFQSFC